MMQADLVIIGGGPAGMSAAIEAAKHDLEIVLLEENSALGGKVLRNSGHGGPEEKVRSRLFSDFHKVSHRIKVFTDTEVWNVNGEKLVEFWQKSDEKKKGQCVKGKKLIVAVGAKDQVVPFPGWQLPGVFTIGCLNSFTQRGVVPAKEVLVAGTGALQIALAYNLTCAGVKVKGLIDCNSRSEMISSALEIFSGGGWRKLLLGAKYMLKIITNGIPIYHGYMVTKAIAKDSSEDAVNSATIAKLDREGRPVPGTEKTFEVEAIGVGYGLIPQTEITELCGCRHSFNDQFGYWIADRTPSMETTVDGIFVAGDGADIKGYEAALDEGRVAALAACKQLGIVPSGSRKENRALAKRLASARAVGAAMSSGARVRRGLLDVVTDDTIICRCEEVCYADIKAAVAEGAKDVNDVKRRTRMGMGNCQGRFCGQFVHDLMCKATGEQLGRTVFTVRPPLKSLPLEVIAKME